MNLYNYFNHKHKCGARRISQKKLIQSLQLFIIFMFHLIIVSKIYTASVIDHTSLHKTRGLSKWTNNLEDAACNHCFFIDTTSYNSNHLKFRRYNSCFVYVILVNLQTFSRTDRDIFNIPNLDENHVNCSYRVFEVKTILTISLYSQKEKQ